jgi:4-cresol dehydrogenase (hydroxylating)
MPPAEQLDPARDGCGLLWFAPIIPMTRDDVAAFRQVIEPIMRRYGFECCITLTAVNERCFDCTLPLLFDRDNPAEVERAMRCYEELSEKCAAAGYYAYRLGLQSMERETSRDDPFWSLVTTIKRAIDPAGVVSPGRYSR